MGNIGNDSRLKIWHRSQKQKVRGNIHHFGIQTSNIEAVVERLKNNGVSFNKDISDLGFWKYIMVPAPDDILIELFEIDKNQIPAEYWRYFE